MSLINTEESIFKQFNSPKVFSFVVAIIIAAVIEEKKTMMPMIQHMSLLFTPVLKMNIIIRCNNVYYCVFSN